MSIPTIEQQKVIDTLFNHDFWLRGRGAGKSWLRDYLIERLIKEEQDEVASKYRKLVPKKPEVKKPVVKESQKRCYCGDFSYNNSGSCGPNGCFNVPA